MLRPLCLFPPVKHTGKSTKLLQKRLAVTNAFSLRLGGGYHFIRRNAYPLCFPDCLLLDRKHRSLLDEKFLNLSANVLQ